MKLQQLGAHRVECDSVKLVEIAVNEKLQRFEAKRLGQAKAPWGTWRTRARQHPEQNGLG